MVEVLSKHAGLWITRNKEIMYSQVSQSTLYCLTIILYSDYCVFLRKRNGVSNFIDYCTAPRDTQKGGRRGKRHSTDKRERPTAV